MKLCFPACVVCAIAVFNSPASAGVLIATSDTFYATLATDSPLGNVDIYISYSDPLGPDPIGMLQVFNVGQLEVGLGTQVLMTGDVAEFMNLVTNGINDSLYLGATSGIDRSDFVVPESEFFFGGPAPGMPDLAGATVDEVRVLLSSYAPAANDEIEIGINFYFYGTIPAPAATSVFALAGLVIRRRARRS